MTNSMGESARIPDEQFENTREAGSTVAGSRKCRASALPPLPIGTKHGKRVVIGAEVGGRNRALCRCECGSEDYVALSDIKRGKAKSCHSCRMTTHGMSRTPEYRTFNDMHRRCRDPKNKFYKDYGGRGITVCDRWSSFEAFIADMGVKPTPKHSLDRIDNEKGYCPENCQWAPPEIQYAKTRRAVLASYNGREQSASAWARELGFEPSVLCRWLQSGLSVADCVATKKRRATP